MSKRSVDSYAFHYVYRLTHPSGLFYVGVHSSDDCQSDKYMGSGVALRKAYLQYPKREWSKFIMRTFSRRIDAEEEEGKIVTHKLLADPNCLNKCLGGVRKR